MQLGKYALDARDGVNLYESRNEKQYILYYYISRTFVRLYRSRDAVQCFITWGVGGFEIKTGTP